jgi:hypothetical protein
MLAQRAASAGALLIASVAAPACELVLAEHRSQRELARLPLDAATPVATITFTHSVLGTPVADSYRWRRDGAAQWRAHLVQETFEGDGYGLPYAAGPGETLLRDGKGWRLTLDRVVHPLVVPPVQGMRVEIDGRPALVLRTLSDKSIELRAQRCGTD